MTPRKIIIISVIALFVLAGVGVYTWYRIASVTTSTKEQTKVTEDAVDGRTPTQIYVTKVSDKANEVARQGDVEQATAVYDQAIKENSNNSVKAELYAQKAATLLAADQPNEALEAAKQAVANDANSFEAMYILAAVYQEMGNNALAAETYRKVADLASEPSDDDPTAYGKQYYLDLATELEQ